MRAHLLGETGEILVTGTQDVDVAKPLARTALIEDNGYTDDEADAELSARVGRATAGVIVPANKEDRHFFGYTWWWREGYGGGRVKAVVFENEWRSRHKGGDL